MNLSFQTLLKIIAVLQAVYQYYWIIYIFYFQILFPDADIKYLMLILNIYQSVNLIISCSK